MFVPFWVQTCSPLTNDIARQLPLRLRAVTVALAVATAPRASLTVTDTGNVPSASYRWLTVGPLAVPPSPSSQEYVSGSPSGSVAEAVSVMVVMPLMACPAGLTETAAVGGRFAGALPPTANATPTAPAAPTPPRTRIVRPDFFFEAAVFSRATASKTRTTF